MKKSILSLATVLLLSTSFSSCKEDTKLDKLEDKLESRSEDLKEAADDIGDVANDIESALENFKDALEDVKNPEDREAIRKRVNDIFDEMRVEIEN